VATRPEFEPVPKRLLQRIERCCRDLLEVSLHEHPMVPVVEVRVRKRSFARVLHVRDPGGSLKTMVVFRADPDERRALLDHGHPFFRSGAGTDMVGAVIDDATDWDELAELLTTSYLLLAPKKLAAAVDAALSQDANSN
jgi:hypothetical protein